MTSQLVPDAACRHVSGGWIIACLLALLIAVGCRQATTETTLVAQVDPDAGWRRPGFLIDGITYEPHAMVVDLRWQGALPNYGEPQSLIFTLPPQVLATATWEAATLDGRALRVADPGAPAVDDVQTTRTPELLASAGIIQYVGTMRRWPIHRLQLNNQVFAPLRDLGDGAATADYRLRLRLEFNTELPAAAASDSPDEPAWRRVVASLVANPDDLERFVQADPPWPADLPQDQTDPRPLAPSAQHWARLPVDARGVVRLDVRELERVGFPIGGVRPEDVRVFSRGRQVPVLIAPGDDAPAGTPPGIYFWAEGNDSPYGRHRIYWVALAPEVEPLRLQTAPPPVMTDLPRLTSVRRTVTRDIDELFQTRHGMFYAFMGMAWVETELTAGRPYLFQLDLPHPADAPGDTVDLDLHFFINREQALYSARVDFGAALEPRDSFRFEGPEDTHKSVTVPFAAFEDGRTTISMTLVERVTDEAASSGIWFDRIDATYPSLPLLIDGRLSVPADTSGAGGGWLTLPDVQPGDARPIVALRLGDEGIAESLLPILPLEDGGGFGCPLAPYSPALEVVDLSVAASAARLERVRWEELIAPSEPADLLILTHAAFREEAERLAAFRRGQGLAVRVADVQSVYDQFSDGEQSPVAIRAMLAHALRHWPGGGAQSVLLVGDASADYRGEARNGVNCWIPSYTYRDGGDIFASEYWLTQLAGDDALADVMLGRLSVASREDAAVEVDKLIAYDRDLRGGPWRARLGYIADIGEFHDVMDEVRREATPPALLASRVSLNEYPLEENWYMTLQMAREKEMKVSGLATRDIGRMFQNGVSLLTFYGHGSPNIWSNERMWFGGDTANSDNLILEGTGTYAFVTNMTCNSGAIDYPLPPWNVCITEDLMRVREGGAIGALVPSGPGETLTHRRLSLGLRQALFESGLRRTGEFTFAGLARYLLNGNPDRVAFMYLLLGDPTTELQLTRRLGTITTELPTLVPGRQLRLRLEGIEPRRGRWVAELVDLSEKEIWRSEESDLDDGVATLEIDVPEGTPAGPAVLRFYAWPGGRSADGDVAIAARVRIETPYLRLAGVELKPASDGSVEGRVRAVSAPRNPASGHVTIYVEDAESSRTLVNDKVREAFVWEGTVRLHGRAQWLVARVESDSMPDDPSLNQVSEQRLALAAPSRGAEFLTGLMAIESEGRLNRWTVRVVAGLSPELVGQLREAGARVAAAVETADGRALRTQPINIEPLLPAAPGDFNRGAIVAARVDLDEQGEGILDGARVRLLRQLPIDPDTPDEELAVLELDHLPRTAPDLWIPADSIRVDPASPTEGDTVFIEARVANRGNQVAPATSLRLLTTSPAEGGQPAVSRVGGSTVRIPSLAPGRDYLARMRWDPMDNAGTRTLWLNLLASTGFTSETTPERLRPVTVVARTRPQPYLMRKPWVEASERDRRNNRVWIHAEVGNRGESPARKVMVGFYRSAIQIEENLLGEVLLEEVPANGSAVASFAWTYRPGIDTVVGAPPPQPSVRVWLKGSVRPALSSEDELPGD